MKSNSNIDIGFRIFSNSVSCRGNTLPGWNPCRVLWARVFTYVLAALICLNGTGFRPGQALAHTPHDPIDVLALTPGYGQDDHTLFIAISDQILKSENGGYSWTQLANGLDHSQLISDIAISPFFTQDRTLFFSTAGDGIYRSQDGGGSWTRDNQGLAQLHIALMDISSSGRVIAVGIDGSLWQKQLQEAAWRQLQGNPKGITAIRFSNTGPEKSILFLGDREGVLYTSLDAGQPFQPVHTFADSGPITVITASPHYAQDAMLLVGTARKGLFKSVDGGAGFSESSSGISDPHIVDIAVLPGDGDGLHLYATTWRQAVFISLDGGGTWRLSSEGLSTDKQADTQEYLSPHFRQLAFSKAFASDRTLFVGGFDGLFVSGSGGADWKQLETLPLSLVKGLDVFSSAESTSIAVTTYGGGAYLSGDKGNRWTIGNKGLATTRLSDIRFSPAYQQDRTLFSASMGYLLRSDDQGNSWRKTALKYNGYRKKAAGFLNTVMIKLKIPFHWTDLLLDDLEQTRPWPTIIAVSKSFEKDRTLFFGTRRHGLYRSTDGGKTHRKVWDAAGRVVTSLVISPDFSHDNTLFASLRGLGVYRSTDGGKAWKKASAGFAFIADWESNALVHQIEKKDIKLLMSPGFKQDRTLFARSSEGLYKTLDAGDTWQRLEDPAFDKSANIIGAGISPNFLEDKTLVISIKGRGLYRSTDAGNSFALLSRELIQQNHNIEYIAFSHLFPSDKTLAAASDEDVFLSTDAGVHWRLLSRPVRYENHRTDVLRYTGDWSVKNGSAFSAGSVSVAESAGAGLELDFVGTGIKWIGPESKDRPPANIFIDDILQPAPVWGGQAPERPTEVFAVEGLAPGAHRIRIEVMATDTTGGKTVSIDAFDIIP